MLCKVEHGPYDHVYVSPHFDDVIFSCGGTLARHARERESVLVLTVCSGTVAGTGAFGARSGQQRRGEERSLAAFEDLELRRDEDRRALGTLGAHSLWLGEDDAIARDRRYRSLPGATGRPRHADAALVRRIEHALRSLPLASGARVCFPLGVGNHVDHQLAFAAGVRLSREPAFDAHVSFYEDVPYVLIPHALRQRMGSLRRRGGVRWQRAPGLQTTGGVAARAAESAAALRALPLVARELTPLSRIALPLYVLALQLQLLPGWRAELPTGAVLAPQQLDVSTEREAKLASIACYASQVATIMGTMENLARALERYAAALLPGARAAERFWRLQPGSAR